MLIYGEATDETDDRGRPIKGETLLLVLNASRNRVTVQMPKMEESGIWAEMADSAYRELRVVTSGCIEVAPFSQVLLRYGENRRMADMMARGDRSQAGTADPSLRRQPAGGQ
jgi:glycogen operon protein